MKKTTVVSLVAVVLAISCFGVVASAKEYLSGIEWAEPEMVDPGTAQKAPADAVVLFDGTDMSQFNGADKWIVADGAVTAGPGAVQSKAEFGDCQLHIEWATATEVKGDGQGRSNSGVFLMGKYEVQVLDSYENRTYFDGQCGAIYKQHPPLVNVCRKPGEWQSYDIIWKAPRFDGDGKLLSPAFITILHNGVLIQNHFQLEGDTPYTRAPEYKAHGERGPISLQFHGNPVRYRNIWVREVKELENRRIHEPKIR
ncbi:MAG: DUF1080 domain-containing protein [Candidatus Nealsonbacteria bacterium]|nr:DUF1080 domain-containing protein [Candidatus Nealsonbacteria bacterium]